MISLKEQYGYGSKRLGVRRPGLDLARANWAVGDQRAAFSLTAEAQRVLWPLNGCSFCYQPVALHQLLLSVPRKTASAAEATEPFGHHCFRSSAGVRKEAAVGLKFDIRFGGRASQSSSLLSNHSSSIAHPNHRLSIAHPNHQSSIAHLNHKSSTTYASFKADVTTAQDYYPFGSLMPGRTYVAPTRAGYRFGFNGMQRDDELKGIGNQLSTLYRIYDARLALWLSIDPEFIQFPEESPYIINQNNPVFNTDPNGDCPWCIGAAVSATLDAGIQLTEIALSEQKSLSDFKWGDVAIAAAAGAAGVGIAARMDKVVKVASAANRVSKPVLKVAANATADVAVSSGAQLAKTGEVDGKKVVIDVFAGATAGRVATDLAEGAAKSSRTGIVLEKQAQRAARVAVGSTRPARQAAATTTAKKAENFVAARGAAAGTATSGIISDLAVRLTAPQPR